jgi:hypothetical protein
MTPRPLMKTLPFGVPLVLLVGLSSVALGILVSAVSLIWSLGAVAAVALSVLFVQRPDVMLLLTVLIRSSTDITVMATQSGVSTAGTILSSPVNIGLILILIFAGGVFILSRKVPLLRLPGGTPFVVLLLTALLGLLNAVALKHTESLLYGLSDWLRPVSSLVVYALAAYVFRGAERIQRVIDVLALSFVAPACAGVYQLVTRDIPLRGTFVDRNSFGIFLVLIFAVFVCQVLASSGARRLVAMSIATLSALLLLATFSRASWAGVTVVLLVLGALRKRALLVLVPLLAVIVIGVVPAISDRLADPFGGSFADRVGIWRATTELWLGDTHDDNSFVSTVVNRLVGTGPGTIGFLILRSYGGPATMEHNDFLMALYEFGALGFLAYLSLYLAVLISGYRCVRQAVDERMRMIALGFVALTLAFLVMSFTSNIFDLTQNQIYYWTLAGLVPAISRLPAGATRGDLSVTENGGLRRAEPVMV